jgi:hypothetical protein
VRHDPEVEAWFSDGANPLRLMTRVWFEQMRACGSDVRERMHDGCPVACVGDVPFGYVNAFKAHANVGFFCGALLADPAGLLEGDGKRMRHVKLRPGEDIAAEALSDLIVAAYHDICERIALATKKTSPAMKKTVIKKTKAADDISPTRKVKTQVEESADWRTKMLARVRAIIQQADPGVVEEVKWRKPSNGMRGVPVWSHGGIICTGEMYKAVVKLTFAKGASLPDPVGVFNASLDGNTRRAIDLHEGDKIDARALAALVRAAVKLNTSAKTPARRSRTSKRSKTG